MEGENITNEFLAFRESQWTSNGSNIYLQTGSVGIGTLAPRATLDVYGSINALSANFGTIYTAGTTLASLNVSGDSNLLGNVIVANLIVTGNLVNVVSNTQFSNSVSINNAGTSTALKVHQLENIPVHTNNVAEFWDYQTLAMVINGDGNVGIHTTLVNPYSFAVVGASNLDYINTINLYSSNAVITSNLYGRLVGSNTVSASTIYGTLAGANTITGSSVSATTLYGQLAGSNTVAGSILYGQLAGSNTISGSSLTLGTALSIANGGTGQTTKSAAFDSLSPMSVAGDLIYGGASGTGTRLATGSTSQLLHGGTTPSWSAVSLTTDVSGTLPVANGGTGLTSTSANFVFAGPTTGAAAAPTWRALVSADIPNNAASTSASAGSLSTTFTSGYVLYGQGTGVPAYSSGHFWDQGNTRLGLNTTSPGYTLDVNGSGRFAADTLTIPAVSCTTSLNVNGQIKVNSIAACAWVELTTPVYTEFSWTGSQSFAVSLNAAVPTTARAILCDIFVTASSNDHQNICLSRTAAEYTKNWVDPRGLQPSTQFGANPPSTNHTVRLTYYGETDGFTSNYGIWYSSQYVPCASRQTYFGNYGNSGSNGWVYIVIRGYTL